MNEDATRDLLEDVADRQKRAAAKREAEGHAYAPEFNPLRFCRTDEIGLSEIIRWMLDPTETHAQGATFLEAFFDVFAIETSGRVAAATCARTEVITHSIPNNLRRIDVLIRCGNYALAIENKPFASFQEDQVPDYCSHLENVAKNGFAIVLLKGWSGPAPSEQLTFGGSVDDRIVDSDYGKVAEWINECIVRCQAASVSAFLDNFRTHVETEILGGVTMREQKMILDAVKGVERQRAALDIIASAEGLYLELHNAFIAAFKRRKKRGWSVTNDRHGRAGRNNASYYHLTVDWGDDVPVLFVLDVPMYGSEAHGGLVKKSGATNVVRKIKRISEHLDEQLFEAFGDGKNWIWWAHQQTFIDEGLLRLSGTNIWKAMTAPDALAQAIIQLAQRLESETRSVL